MRRDIAFVLALSAVAMGSVCYAVDASAQPYCPPGSKFCPAPGANNTVYLDTHFGVDAQTGKMTAYKGTEHPDDVFNPPQTGERVLYVAPPISVENRYVPYPGAPDANMQASTQALAQPLPVTYASPAPAPATYAQPAPAYAQRAPQSYQPEQPRQYEQPRQTAAPAAPREDVTVATPSKRSRSKPSVWTKLGLPIGRGEPQSEVANSQAHRSLDQKREPVEDDKIPWWKGGMWRNRKSDDDDGKSSSKRPAPRTAAADADDDMWDDDEFTGYNPDGSFGRPATGPYAAPSFGNNPNPNPYDDPYASQQQYPTQTYQAQAEPTGQFLGETYTMPNSPPPTSPYQEGYVYPGTEYSYDSTYQGSVVSTGTPSMYVATPDSGYMQSSPVSQSTYNSAPPAPVETGSPQFENAVRMVKDNRFSEAKSILTGETSRNPGNADAWRWLGDCHYNLLELDAAITCYERALAASPNDYYALRGQGFSYLHRGHEYWRRMQEEVSLGQKEQAAATFSQAHENYKKSLEVLGFCLRRAPNDGEAVYGEAMAAEGASRKLYSNAISYLKLGPEQREKAELFAENCITVINKGIERAKERARDNPGDAGPRALLGGLYLRKAILYHSLGKRELALIELKNSHDVQKSILDEIDKNNATAQKNIKECENYWEAWGGKS